MTDDTLFRKTKLVPCPRCGAASGKPCRSVRGIMSSWPHNARIALSRGEIEWPMSPEIFAARTAASLTLEELDEIDGRLVGCLVLLTLIPGHDDLRADVLRARRSAKRAVAAAKAGGTLAD